MSGSHNLPADTTRDILLVGIIVACCARIAPICVSTRPALIFYIQTDEHKRSGEGAGTFPVYSRLCPCADLGWRVYVVGDVYSADSHVQAYAGLSKKCLWHDSIPHTTPK